MQTPPQIDTFLTQMLRGAPQPLELPDTPEDNAANLRRVQFHGLIAITANCRQAMTLLPSGLAEAIRIEARREAIIAASRERVLVRLVEGLATAGVEHLLCKGARLAYSLYADPGHRSAGDIDLLIRPGDRSRARAELRRQGYSHKRGLRDGLHQEDWVSPPEFGLVHHLDLHRALSNSPAIAHRIFPSNPFAHAIPLPALSPSARGLDNVLSLIAGIINQCLHTHRGYVLEGQRVAGHGRLGWVYDNHLLASALADDDWRELEHLIIGSGAAPLVLAALVQAHQTLGTSIPEHVTEALARDPAESWLTRYIRSAGFAERLRCDLGALAGPGELLALLRGNMFPPAEFMRQRFPDRAHWPLWSLYGLRLLGRGRRP